MAEAVLLFGAKGAIGSAVRDQFLTHGWRAVTTSRKLSGSESADSTWVGFDPLSADFAPDCLDRLGPFSAVCWAQGTNVNDNVRDVDVAKHRATYESNCLFIVASLQLLLQRELLTKPARLCVISSIWQELARQNKLTYCMTKAALRGLVLSAAADLATDGHLINAVLPGALDTPMTRSNLTAQQVQSIEAMTGFGRLPALSDVAGLVHFLCSAANTGITGQFVAADLGFSHVRIV